MSTHQPAKSYGDPNVITNHLACNLPSRESASIPVSHSQHFQFKISSLLSLKYLSGSFRKSLQSPPSFLPRKSLSAPLSSTLLSKSPQHSGTSPLTSLSTSSLISLKVPVHHSQQFSVNSPWASPSNSYFCISQEVIISLPNVFQW